MNSKNVLVVTPRYPYPVVGGDRLRIYHICRELSKYHNISLVSLCDDDEMQMGEPDDSVFTSINRIHLPRLRSIFNVALSLFTKKPLQVAYYQSDELRRFISCNSHKYDVVIFHLIRTKQYVDSSRATSNLLELTDAISLNYSRMSSDISVKGLKYLAFKLEKERLLDYEVSAVQEADSTILISEVDKNYLADHGANKDRMIISGNGIDADRYCHAFNGQSRKLIFIGSMDFLPNLDAALWFSTEIMPKLREFDDFTLEIIGRISPHNEKKFSGLCGVKVIGEVDSVSEAAVHALAGVGSIRMGAGVQNKVLEYMAMSLPSVVSPFAAEGLGGEAGKHYIICDKAEEYVEAILKLRTDVEDTLRMSVDARRFMENSYSWDSKLEPYVSLVGGSF